MKVLVATSDTQGARTNDVHYCIEGELLWLPPPCDRDHGDSHGACGCGRASGGLSSHRATTTARVADLDITAEDYLAALRSSLDEQGWTGHLTHEHAEALLIEARDGLAAIAAAYPTGTIVETSLGYVTPEPSCAAPSIPRHRRPD